jgi:hypothetical protein
MSKRILLEKLSIGKLLGLEQGLLSRSNHLVVIALRVSSRARKTDETYHIPKNLDFWCSRCDALLR